MHDKNQNPDSIPEKVIVCLSFPAIDYHCDVELPSQMLIKDVTTGLLRLMISFNPRVFSRIKGLSVTFKGRALDQFETLASAGVWDGSDLVVEETFALGSESIWLTGR